MGLKDYLVRRNGERIEAERREKEQIEAEWKSAGFDDILDIQPHPLRWRSSEMVDDYVLGQLIIREEIPPTEDGERLLFVFAKSLNLSKERLEELSQTAALYDDQAKSEHLEKLALYLGNVEAIYFLCDVARLHGVDYQFNGDIREMVQNLGRVVFQLDDRTVENILRLCATIAENRGCKSPSVKDIMSGLGWKDNNRFDGISDDIVAYFRKNAAFTSITSDYLVIDLSGGKNAEEYSFRYTKRPPDLDDDTCRTTELWLRRIPAGTFMMGSPSNELGRYDDEIQHSVTLTQDFYIGIFPVTQRQWELVMGGNPSYFKASGPCAPVEKVSYDAICGSGRQWPSNSSVSSDSFLGRLRSRTKLEGFDLPTEAQWEIACRAGTTTALNSGKDLASSEGSCRNLDEVGWYRKNSGGRTHPVGEKRPNARGLYDMHGNVWEWCRDWYGSYSSGSVTNPNGAGSGSYCVIRGGCWSYFARFCRAANRYYYSPGFCYYNLGFRLLFVPVQ